ncbi:MAG: tetratricopeptide repeat protein [Sphingobacterium sp.]|nr:tetratricopeptide repeat protein [Sphingobacterium sp.]
MAKYPGEKDAYHELGRSYASAKLYPQALAMFEKALALDPDFGPLLNEAAYACLRDGGAGQGHPLSRALFSGESGGPEPSGFDRRDARAHRPARRRRRQVQRGPGRPSRFLPSWASSAVRLRPSGRLPGDPALPRRAGRPGPGGVGQWLTAYFRSPTSATSSASGTGSRRNSRT